MRKYVLIGLGTLIFLLCMLGTSYALWTLNLAQKEENYLATSCFDVTFLEDSTSTILLQNTYPLTDEEGMNLVPYVFTIKNNCSAYAKYDLSLEILQNSTLNSQYLKVQLDDRVPRVLNSYEERASTSSNTSSSYLLHSSYLDKNESKTMQFRVWLDENVTKETEGVQGARWGGRITVTASYANEVEDRNAVSYITALSQSDSVNFIEDGTVDHNIRYVGSNPNNYVTFGETYKTDIYDWYDETGDLYFGMSFSSLEECEEFHSYLGFYERAGILSTSTPICKKIRSQGDPILWRIIGMMNNISDENGNKTSKLKLIRNDSIGRYSWDSSATEINNGWGINEWSESDLNFLLNDYLYSNKANQVCFVGENLDHVPCSFDQKGFTTPMKSMIDSTIWNTGTTNAEFDLDEEGYWIGIQSIDHARQFYEFERSENTGKVCDETDERCNDTVERKTISLGFLGLMYPSDYLFAEGSLCTEELINAGEECTVDNWLYLKDNTQWTMTPFPLITGGAFHVYAIFGDTLASWLGNNELTSPGNAVVRPVVYLNKDVQILSGTGEENMPYQLGFS